MSYPGKYRCHCGSMHYEDETCPGNHERNITQAANDLGIARVREILAEIESQAAAARHLRQQEDRRNNEQRRMQRIIDLQAEIDRLKGEG